MKNKRHAYVTCKFSACNTLKESAFIHEMNYLSKVCTFLPSIFMTGVHPPSTHPKFPMWQKTDNGWESTRRVTTPLILDLLNQNEKKKKKKRNTTSNENNDGEIKLELMKIIIIATTMAMKTIMAKILSDNDNDTTNKKVTSVSTVWSGISLTHFICSSLHIHLRETYTMAIRFKDRFSVELGRGWYT